MCKVTRRSRSPQKKGGEQHILHNIQIICFGSAVLTADTVEDAVARAKTLSMNQIQWSPQRVICRHDIAINNPFRQITEKTRRIASTHPDSMDAVLGKIAGKNTAYPSGIGKKLADMWENADNQYQFDELFKTITGLSWEDYINQSEAEITSDQQTKN